MYDEWWILVLYHICDFNHVPNESFNGRYPIPGWSEKLLQDPDLSELLEHDADTSVSKLVKIHEHRMISHLNTLKTCSCLEN